ncbi:hypothetical protein [Janthinobacterium sp. BJB401]|uniref:hypothetical protein n=1 Tax=Janthinobacterium sp. BJB401 TaxID=2745934 RepID=UPI001594F97A|nr:hypothetical protein [Janthinobacterium sp. BJB401]NVI82707.1 hypothetical protein [Janthinobacterium sp. BJB401]
MHDAFVSFVESGKALAKGRGMAWDFPLDDAGASVIGWNLTEIIRGRPPTHYLRDLGQDTKALAFMNALRVERGHPPLVKSALSTPWQDFIKAATCDQLLFKRNTPSHVAQNIIRPLKVLATWAGTVEPWQLTADVARDAISMAGRMQKSGKLADLVIGIIKTVVDTNHLSENCPLSSALPTERLAPNPDRKSKEVKSKDEIRQSLEHRKRAERLPTKRAFWELVRIIFTETPRTFVDAIRFNALKAMVLSGLRVGEMTGLPADWKRFREYYDANGRPAGESGGYSKALMLRHFAEKQQPRHGDSAVLIEKAQYVPKIFSEIITATLDDTVRLTQPLRDTLKRQVETGRMLPQFGENDLVPVAELYPFITGNPFWLKMGKELSDDYVARYRQGFDAQVLQSLAQHQHKEFEKAGALDSATYVYYNRLLKNDSKEYPLLKLRHSSGEEYAPERKTWREVFVRVGELENYLAASAPTKLSDITSLKLGAGEFQAWEFLYLTPKRALSEERNDGICDITRYCSVGVPNDMLLLSVLGDVKDQKESLFMRYGQTVEDRALTLDSHMLRHLLTNELFRLGLADTIISKHLNRRDVAQSYEYDHRTLAEHLEDMDLPAGTEVALGQSSATVAALILAGKAVGPIATTYKRIQREQGDQAAFEYLRVEADGYHSTPYGACVQSFMTEPCPLHLQCFTGCSQLIATGLPENRRNLEGLEVRFQAALSDIQARPVGTVGRKNQLQHATIGLEGVRKLLSTPRGKRVFPDGPDLSKLTPPGSVLDD